MKIFSLFALAALAIFTHCGTSPQQTNATGYRLSPSEGEAGDMVAPTESGGRIDLGGDGLRLGHSSSTATKTISSCGDKAKCVFSISVGSRKSGANSDFEDNEQVQITFGWGSNQSKTDTYSTINESYPQHVELPTCGPVTITITMTEGDNPGIKSQARVGPLTYWCDN